MIIAESLLFILKDLSPKLSYLEKSLMIAGLIILYAAAILMFLLWWLRSKRKSLLKQAAVIVITLDLLLGIRCCIPFLDCQTKSAEPELIATVDTSELNGGGYYCEYKVDVWPFDMTSYNDGLQLCPFWIPEFEVARNYISDLEEYTYIFSFGEPISRISWNIWDSLKLLPSLWCCHVMHPVIESESSRYDCIFVYRIDKVYIECYG